MPHLAKIARRVRYKWLTGSIKTSQWSKVVEKLGEYGWSPQTWPT